MFEPLLHALPYVFQPANLFAMVAGVVLGIAIGALPGLSATMGIAVLIPLTFGLDPLVGLGMMAGIYNGAMYGGAIPAVLLRIPGTPASIVTTFDGYPMAQKGEAGRALQIAVVSSAIGGMVSAVVLMTLAPPLARVTLAFGPAEYFWVGIFGLSAIAVFVGKNPIKGVLSACIGLLIGCIGIDTITGAQRFTFGNINLYDGFNIVVLLTGLYAIPPAIAMAEEAVKTGISRDKLRVKSSHGMFDDWRRLWKTWTRSSIIGVIVGLLPGAGGNIAAFLSYNEAKRASKTPDEFGEGSPEGVAAGECGNNADNSAALVPALTLGVPGSSVAAVILGGLLIHGLRPGPALFRDYPDVVYGFMIQMFVTSALLMFIGGIIGTRVFIHVLRLPRVLLVPLIAGLTAVGVYSINNSMFDLYMMLGFGLLGYAMERLDFPLAPAVLGLILGPMAEENMRLALLISQNDWLVFVTRPISVTIAVLTLLVLAFPIIRDMLARRRTAPA
ncbi:MULTISPECIES: tripartite tricarboxylate transporter permease [Aurantimonas]|uniref:tripartite tricarboxylate transporter permease n=1 Tax=Aurantimonas TaxID=182269 RepID=UPI000429C2A1|nr:tripartite tricarboxylate transporter permease [Aurantimonas coralicida]MBC6717902.1 tripartite tricarboxylate transporter permease [Aurantimonas sp. DM33-3]MDE0925103.1 tripartite tricarboxylate transporter permease [Aurantimonas coralicida]